MTSSLSPLLRSYVAKLERRMPLPDAERSALLALPAKADFIRNQRIVIARGEPARRCVIVHSGLVCRQHSIEPREITAFCVPGDAVDLQSLWFQRVDHSIVAYDDTILIVIEHRDLLELFDRFPLIGKRLWHDSLVDAAIFRQWTVVVGHLRAEARIAHLLLEFAARLEALSGRAVTEFELRPVQSDLADALGLSLVHFNKSLRRLRENGLVVLKGRQVAILNKPGLVELSGFNSDYLHLATPPKLDAEGNHGLCTGEG